MNFKKNKDVKRASYYVWFLGAKESKGLRGDEYVQPVLNYLLDNECDLEPSKVTLQVSSKGLKIIQILTIPRKSSKLNAEQQLQLFAASNKLVNGGGGVKRIGGGGNGGDLTSQPSSVMKSEQVKHHIPHDSISWVYQEEDVICAILLLYNPITRCPVHIHAYRCDSIQTANNLHQQLQTLVDRPENQKKFREIESRLAAKGLLIPPPPPPITNGPANGYHHGPHVPFNDRPSHFDSPTPPHHHHDSKRPYQSNSPSASKTLNSDGRSTRTDGSDEMNSEESNSSDLGYAIRSKTRDQPFLRSLSTTKSGKSQQSMAANHNSKTSNNNHHSLMNMETIEPDLLQPNLYDSLAAELRAKLGNPKMGPLLLPPRDYDSQQKSAEPTKSKSSRNNKQDKNNKKLCPLTRSESTGKCSSGIGSDEALCGNKNNANSNSNRQRSFYFERTPSLTKMNTNNDDHGGNSRSSYLLNNGNDDVDDDRCSIDRGDCNSSSSSENEYCHQPLNHRFSHVSDSMVDCLEVDVEDFEEDVIFTTTIAPSTTTTPPTAVINNKNSKSSGRMAKTTTNGASKNIRSSSSSRSPSANNTTTATVNCCSKSSSSTSRSKSTFDLAHQPPPPPTPPSSSSSPQYVHQPNNNTTSNDFDVMKTRQLPHQHVQHQFYRQKHLFYPQMATTNITTVSNNNTRGGRDNENSDIPKSNHHKKKSSLANVNLVDAPQHRPPLKEVNRHNHQQYNNNIKSSRTNLEKSTTTTTTTTSAATKSLFSSSVIGRREQRFNAPPSSTTTSTAAAAAAHQNQRSSTKSGPSTTIPSLVPTQKFYFADAEFASSSSGYRDHRERRYHRNVNGIDNQRYHRGRSMGRLDQVPNDDLDDFDDGGGGGAYGGPMSLNFSQPPPAPFTPPPLLDDMMNDRAVSPPYYVQQQQHHPHQQPPISSISPRGFVPKNTSNVGKRYPPTSPQQPAVLPTRDLGQSSRHHRSRDLPAPPPLAPSTGRDRRFDQPYSRYSYIDMMHEVDEDLRNRNHPHPESQPISMMRFSNLIRSKR